MNTAYGEIPHDYEITGVKLVGDSAQVEFTCKLCGHLIIELFDVHNFVNCFYDWFVEEPACDGVEVTA